MYMRDDVETREEMVKNRTKWRCNDKKMMLVLKVLMLMMYMRKKESIELCSVGVQIIVFFMTNGGMRRNSSDLLDT